MNSDDNRHQFQYDLYLHDSLVGVRHEAQMALVKVHEMEAVLNRLHALGGDLAPDLSDLIDYLESAIDELDAQIMEHG